MLATAIKLAEDHGAAITALHVVRVPLDQPFEAGFRRGGAGETSLAEAKLLAAERRRGSRSGSFVRGRSGKRSTRPAAQGVDLIVMGSSPRWRRQSRFFGPTVDYVLRKAPAR